MKYFYLDKNHAKNGIVMSAYSNSKPEPYYVEEGYAEYIGDSLPIYVYYDEAKDLVRPSTLEELVTLGVKKLEPNQILEGGNIKTFNPAYEYIENNEIKSKTREMLVLEEIEKPFDNEYIKNGKLKTIPKKPKDMVKGEFDFIQEQWNEKATDDEKLENLKEKIVIINSEILRIKSAGFVDIKLEKELERLKDLHYQLSYDIANKLNENF
ncbi:hypothetical protein MKD34_09150 (plasmid) [Cetobacterium somerae]|uniref:hypothetical protein n=1 Tax=Cetobacterium somerae TaxID=188913 RepID=UPI001F0591D7|nr:hypothetical protein [Cetobacterium somerae]UPO98439.1 hypothetical protein MKD34_09150 [Cetobacterium somerae]